MTEGELALARYILEQVREEKEVILSNREKVDLDSVKEKTMEGFVKREDSARLAQRI